MFGYIILCSVQKRESEYTVHLSIGSASAERLGQGEMGGVYLKGVLHLAAARLGYKRGMFCTGWANSSLAA